MPCLNEAETLARCIEKAKTGIQKSGVRGEILIADNGSTDGSQAIAEAAGARVIALRTTVPETELHLAGADWVVDNCADIELLDVSEGLRLRLREGQSA
jgi:glycosyltransferase involved in cell wall biosynthesis